MKYAIKMEDQGYANIEQQNDTDIDVYSFDDVAGATFFDDLNEAKQTARDINSHTGSYFTFFSKYKAIAVVEVIIAEGAVHTLEVL